MYTASEDEGAKALSQVKSSHQCDWRTDRQNDTR